MFNCLHEGNKVIIRNAIKSNSYISKVTIVIGNIVNPSPAFRTDEFTGQIGSDFAVSNGNSNVQLEASNFISCSATFNSAPANRTGQTLTISLLSSELMDTDVYIVVTFPLFWTRDLAQQSMPIANTMICNSSIVKAN